MACHILGGQVTNERNEEERRANNDNDGIYIIDGYVYGSTKSYKVFLHGSMFSQ